jgi:hypothetical protein
MKTLALRFGEHFAPKFVTIAAHQEVTNRLSYVWYGKLGAAVTHKLLAKSKNRKNLRFCLLIVERADRY